jgi:hypothetical protein
VKELEGKREDEIHKIKMEYEEQKTALVWNNNLKWLLLYSYKNNFTNN